MSDARGPRDGDFVAYIEQLQKESAERLHAQATMAHGADKEHGAASRGFEPSTTGTPAPGRSAAPAVGVLATGFAFGVGVYLIAKGLLFSGGAVAALIGTALLLWSAPRLRARFGQRAIPRQRANRDMVEDLFKARPK